MSSESVFNYNGSKDIKEFVIPNNVTKIGEYAFRGCSSLNKAIVPSFFKNILNVFPENCILEKI